MKILYVFEHTGLGGGETSFLYFLAALDRRRYVPIVLVPDDGPLAQRARAMGVAVEQLRLPTVSPLRLRLPHLPAAVRLRRLCRTHGIDVLHTHAFNPLWYAAWSALLDDLPVVWTCHGWWPSGRVTGTMISRVTRRVIAVSSFVATKLAREGHVAASRISQVPLGVDPLTFKRPDTHNLRREFGIGDDELLVGMVGRFQPVKGQREFVQAAALLGHRTKRVRFLLVGSAVFGTAPEQRYQEEVLGQIRALGLQERFLVTGFRADTPHVLAMLDLLVVPSQMETFGVVVLEAMAVGTPVVASAVGGLIELIEHGTNGWLVPPAQPAALADAIVELLALPERRRQLAEAGRRMVEGRFDVRQLTRRIEQIYDEVCSAEAE